MHDSNHSPDPIPRRVQADELPWAHTMPIATAPPLPTSNDRPPNDSPGSAAADCQCGGVGWYSGGPSLIGGQASLIRCACGQRLDSSRAARRLGDELGDLAHCTFTNFEKGRPLATIYHIDSRYYQKLKHVPTEHQAEAKKYAISPAMQETCLVNAYDDARAYAAQPRGWLCFHGAYGAGKSHLAAAIAHVRVQSGWAVRYRSVPGMLDALKSGFADKSSDAIFDDLLGCDLLILDDLGAQHLSGWAYERLFRILNERLDKPTIITANAHPDDLGDPADLDAARLADRIAQAARMIWMPISSYRRIGKAGAS